MQNVDTITFAEKFIAPITGTDTRHYETTAPGHYTISEFTAEETQDVTAADVAATIVTWSTEILGSASADKVEVDTACAVMENRFDDAIALIERRDNQVGLDIWDRLGLMVAEASAS